MGRDAGEVPVAATSSAATSHLDRVRAEVDRWSSRRSFLAVLVLLLAVYLPTATWDYTISIDAQMTAMSAWHLVEHGTLDLSDYVPEDPGQLTLHLLPTPDGGYHSNRTPGVILWGAAFFGVFSPWVGPLMNFPMYPATLAAVLASALAMAVLHLLFRRLVSPFEATVAALVAGLATTTWAVSADGLWPHGPSQLWLALGMLATAASWFATAGASYAMALLVRPTNAIAAAVAGVGASLARRWVWPAVRMGLVASLGVVALVVYNDLIFGTPSIVGGYADVSTIGAPGAVGLRTGGGRFLWNLAGAFVDPQRGMLWYSPFLVLLVPGLRSAWRDSPAWVRDAAVGGVGVFLAQYWAELSQGGEYFFAYRYQLGALTLAAPLLVLSWKAWVADHARRQQVFRILVVLAVSLQVLGAAVEPYER